MNWLNVAFGFVFFCNIVFIIGAAYLLMQVLKATTEGRDDIVKAANQNIEAGSHLKLAARRAFNEMEKANDVNIARENANARAVSELTFQIKTLVDNLKKILSKANGVSQGSSDSEAYSRSDEEAHEQLHAELMTALNKNNQLQDEIGLAKNKLKDATTTSNELRQDLSETKGIKKSTMDRIMQRTAELEEQLKNARDRAKTAEKHAEDNATQLDIIREQLNNTKLNKGGGSSDNTSEELQRKQEQIDTLQSREKQLLARIEDMEREFQRNQTEKKFIEERFVQLDSSGKKVS
jgi:chromosome segregation ATPase